MKGLNIEIIVKLNVLVFSTQHPQEKQPFYLTEEERRTLIAEGLPVPTGLPLTKVLTTQGCVFTKLGAQATILGVTATICCGQSSGGEGGGWGRQGG